MVRAADRSLTFYESRKYCNDNKLECSAFEKRVKNISCCPVKRLFYEDSKEECMSNRDVNDVISCAGVEMLPITIIDGALCKLEKYSSDEEIRNMKGKR